MANLASPEMPEIPLQPLVIRLPFDLVAARSIASRAKIASTVPLDVSDNPVPLERLEADEQDSRPELCSKVSAPLETVPCVYGTLLAPETYGRASNYSRDSSAYSTLPKLFHLGEREAAARSVLKVSIQQLFTISSFGGTFSKLEKKKKWRYEDGTYEGKKVGKQGSIWSFCASMY